MGAKKYLCQVLVRDLDKCTILTLERDREASVGLLSKTQKYNNLWCWLQLSGNA